MCSIENPSDHIDYFKVLEYIKRDPSKFNQIIAEIPGNPSPIQFRERARAWLRGKVEKPSSHVDKVLMLISDQEQFVYSRKRSAQKPPEIVPSEKKILNSAGSDTRYAGIILGGDSPEEP